MFSFIQLSSTIRPLEVEGRDTEANCRQFEACSLIGEVMVTGVPSRAWSKCLPGTALGFGVGMKLCEAGRALVGVRGRSKLVGSSWSSSSTACTHARQTVRIYVILEIVVFGLFTWKCPHTALSFPTLRRQAPFGRSQCMRPRGYRM